METKIFEICVECLDACGVETTPQALSSLKKEVKAMCLAYEEEYEAIHASRERAREARKEAIRLACADLIGGGMMPFLARRKAEQEKDLCYERAQKFSQTAQKFEFLLKFWDESQNAGGVKPLLLQDLDGKWDITIKCVIALYRACED